MIAKIPSRQKFKVQAKEVWKPLPGSQSLAIACPFDRILYHGTRGPGKTEGQLGKFAAYVDKGYGKFWRGVIFGRTYKNLDDIISKSQRFFPKVFEGAEWKSSKDQYKWVFPGGEELLFRHIKRASDYEAYHGHEYPFIGWNELTMYPTRELYDLMMSCNRSGFDSIEHSPNVPKSILDEANFYRDCGDPIPKDILKHFLPPIPLIVFSTTNPHGPGHNWVKRDIIDRSPVGVPYITKATVFNPRTQRKEEIKKSQVHIFGSYRENRYLTPEYVAELDAIRDPNKRKAWLGGDWAVASGGALDGFWEPRTHIIPRFKVPASWKLARSFDWGSSHPFSTGFWAIANGEEVTLPNGKKFCPKKGSLIRVAGLYGVLTTKTGSGQFVPAYGTNKGVGWEAKKVARKIRERGESLLKNGWVQSRFRPGPADSQIYAVTEKESGSIASKMEEEGIKWIPADKKPGSRKNGLEMFKSMLASSVTGEGKGFYVMDNCDEFIQTVPYLPRDEDDPDDVDTDAEDHVWDETRYMVLEDRPAMIQDIKTTRAR